MRLKVSSAERRPFCLGLNVLNYITMNNPCFVFVIVTRKSRTPNRNMFNEGVMDSFF